jgi:thymidine kinase
MRTSDVGQASRFAPSFSRGLTFVFGPMGSGKSSCLIRESERARSLQLDPIVLVAGIEHRSTVRSRSGLSVAGQPVEGFDFAQLGSNNVLLIDEAQFLIPRQVDVIAEKSRGVGWVQCVGLLLDFRGLPFVGSLALLSVSDWSVPCLPFPPCHVCGSPAIGDSLLDEASVEAPRRYANVCVAHLARVSCPR